MSTVLPLVSILGVEGAPQFNFAQVYETSPKNSSKSLMVSKLGYSPFQIRQFAKVLYIR